MTQEAAQAVSTERVWAEVARITAGADFSRAPVMRRLLEFLVGATIDGRGDQLKAYSVAVDGLGRPDDFDAQIDSYPRVQVGRLRRMLDAFYAREGASGGLRLSIPSGRYRVVFAAEPAPEPVAPPAPEVAPAPPPPAPARHTKLAIAVAVALALLLIGAIAAWRLARPAPVEAGLPQAPVVKLAHLRASPALDALEIDADALLLDGLRRSWVVRVRADEKLHATGAEENAAGATYMLSGEIGEGAKPLLRLRLMRAGTGELVWTGQAALPMDRTQLREALAPLIAELIQPHGVIATDQRAQIADDAPLGYSCLLRFDQYRRERSPAMHALVTTCVARTLERDERDAGALAAQSILAMDDTLFGFDPKRTDAAAASLSFARRAVAADPYSAFAHMALTRASVFNGNCPAAVRSARRAVALNPNDPDLMGLVAMPLLRCGDPGAEPLLRRAVALDPNAPPFFAAPLVFLALERGDLAVARATANAMTPSPNASSTSYDVVMATVAAASGDRASARAAWDRVRRIDPATARDPHRLFVRWMLPDDMQARLWTTLKDAGLIAT